MITMIYKVVISTLIAVFEFVLGYSIAKTPMDRSSQWSLVGVGVLFMAAFVGMWM